MAKDKVIPVRLSEDELAMVDKLAKKTGLPRAEIIRRAYRFLNAEVNRRGSAGFLLDEVPPESQDAAEEEK